MKFQTVFAATAVTLAFALAGCASDGSMALSTGSIIEDTEKAKSAQRVDPACVSLMARIDELRKEGTPERIAKVAAGKGKTAQVKRDALARMTELDNANNEFQQKCSTLAAPKAAPAKAAAVAAPPAKSASTAAKETVSAIAPATAENAATNKAAAELEKTAAVTASNANATAIETASAAQ